ncbi:MAG TPA: cytochrome P450 [Burkholderiaceae bacterium]|jgi:cytochrome P450
MSTPVISKKIPPGPKTPWFGLPIVGEMQKDMLGTVQQLREQYGDVVHLKIAHETYYYIFSPELVREILVDHAEDFISHERVMDVFTLIYGANVMTTEGSTWKRQRRILAPGFLPKKIANYLDLMFGAVTDSFSANLPQTNGKSAVLDVDQFTNRLTMDVILRVLFSHKSSEDESIRVCDAVRALEHQSMRELFWPKTPPNWFPYPGRTQKLQAKAILDNLISGQIKERRDRINEHADKTDYLAMLLSAHDEEAQSGSLTATLSNAEIHDNCSVIFAAGHDTTAGALTWWIGLMTQHPEYAERARQEINEVLGDKNPAPETLTRLTWLTATIKESLRLCPPVVTMFVRRAIRDVQIGEWRIPKGTAAHVPIWHIHHDPRWFPEPEKFQPERFMPGAPEIPRGAYMPFGTGPRVCIGQHFAMIEMTLIAAMLLRQFDFEFIAGESLPKPKIEMLLRPEKPLQINFIRR